MISGHGRPHEEFLEEYVLLAKGASGSACAAVIKKALSDPKVLVFGELMELPKVIELQQSHPEVYQLLDIFAYGTYPEYRATQKGMALPELDETMSRKLKTLTLVNLATSSGTSMLRYSDLSEQLDIGTVRDVEDHLIEAIANDIISGHLNQQEQYVHVTFVMGRDLRKGELQRILLSLDQWSGRCQTMLATLEEKGNAATTAKTESIAYQKEVAKRIEDTKTKLESQRGVGGSKTQTENIFAFSEEKNNFWEFSQGMHGDAGLGRNAYGSRKTRKGHR